MNWEILAETTHGLVRRTGRFIAADLKVPHHTISTSVRNGGQTDYLRHLINHQSCEGSSHNIVFDVISAQGEEAYHDAVCAEIGVPPGQAAVMGTAANMNFAALVSRGHADVEALAIVTAGVQTNATCAGDPAMWCETDDGFGKPPPRDHQYDSSHQLACDHTGFGEDRRRDDRGQERGVTAACGPQLLLDGPRHGNRHGPILCCGTYGTAESLLPISG